MSRNVHKGVLVPHIFQCPPPFIRILHRILVLKRCWIYVDILTECLTDCGLFVAHISCHLSPLNAGDLCIGTEPLLGAWDD